ncbi:MAG: orotate phosphoribosyltransferase, partial [Roseburia sp.]|nr:orotate phosphoribosyltransferase [Roseburia sp.]
GKHVILLSASTTTGKTIHRSLEGIRYYGGVTEAVASVFSTVNEMDGFQVHAVFHAEDLPGYAAYTAQDCPFCKKGIKLDAVVNGFGYSKL